MKKLIIITLLLFAGFIPVLNVKGQTVQNGKLRLLDAYYGVKDALVAGDAAKAAKKATEFVDVLQDAASELSSAVFNSVKAELISAARMIGAASDLGKQRDTFSKLSEKMIQVVKGSGAMGTPVHVDYCPMKKASWLSAEQTIKNPYYGSSMLTCGKVVETIK